MPVGSLTRVTLTGVRCLVAGGVGGCGCGRFGRNRGRGDIREKRKKAYREKEREGESKQRKGQEPTIPNRHPRLPPDDAQRIHRDGRGPELVEVADVGPGDGVDGLVPPGTQGGWSQPCFL